MKKSIFATLLLVIAMPLFAVTKPLTGSYPIVLSHGLFGWGSDSTGVIDILSYWGGMDSYLRSQGAVVYAPTKSPTASNQTRASDLQKKVALWMAANGYTKVHYIGHSQGGLDTRYAITNLGLASKTSTFSSLSGVHHGSPVADVIAGLPTSVQGALSLILNAFVPIIYGKTSSNVLAALGSLTKSGVAAFNAATPNAAGVKYYSYAAHISIPDLIQHPLMGIVWPVCSIAGAANGYGSSCDGLVPVSSAKWGTYMGEPSYGFFTTGIDHLEISNTLYSGQTWFDAPGFFLKVAQNAKSHQ
ncbi:MAG: lipase [Spirochaetia bacterium]|nr:lipase [Spirochaetia bacterium]